MRSLNLAVLMSVLWTGCRSDVAVIQRDNVAPVVAIYTPTDGSTFTELDTIELQASVADGDGLDDVQSVRWISTAPCLRAR